jgi:hypothetical protein
MMSAGNPVTAAPPLLLLLLSALETPQKTKWKTNKPALI